jgi:hypothetical protein
VRQIPALITKSAGSALNVRLLYALSKATTAYQMPPDSTRERLGRLIDAAKPNIGGRQAHLLRWHLGLSR